MSHIKASSNYQLLIESLQQLPNGDLTAGAAYCTIPILQLTGGLEVFRKLKSKKKAECMAEQILEAIKEGVLKRGDKLPSELEIAEMAAVSRPSASARPWAPCG